MSAQNNEPSMEEWIKFQQNMNAIMHDLKIQVGQLANSAAGSGNLPSQPIPNPKGGNVSVVALISGKELQVAPRPKPNPADIESEPEVDSQAKTTPLPFPSRTISTKKPETDEELLKMFWRVEVNIPLLDTIKNKLKEGVEVGGVLVTFIQKKVASRTKPVLSRKCRDPGIFSVPCIIGDCTFANVMLDLGASINSLNFGDLEPTGVVIQLANRSVVQPVGLLEDVLVQVNDLIFPIDFYVLEMENETSRKGSTLIPGRPFLMTARMKIDVHVGTLSMEFGDNLVQFNIFDAMRHPTEDHSLYSMGVIDELVEEYNQFDSGSNNMTILVEISNMLEGAGFVMGDADCTHINGVLNHPNYGNHVNNPANLMNTIDSSDLLDQPRSITDSLPPQSPPNELKPLPHHLKYAYSDQDQTRREIVDSPLETQEIKRVETFRPSKNQSLHLHA
ncbi:hypothetical protein CR513_02680, partial [Mucuna pruriens]